MSNSLKKMSRPKIRFDNLPKVSTRPDQQIATVETPRQNKLLSRKVAQQHYPDKMTNHSTVTYNQDDKTFDVGPTTQKKMDNQKNRDLASKKASRFLDGSNYGVVFPQERDKSREPFAGAAVTGKMRSKFETAGDEEYQDKLKQNRIKTLQAKNDHYNKYKSFLSENPLYTKQDLRQWLLENPKPRAIGTKVNRKDTKQLPKDKAIARGRGIDSTIEHEGAHALFSEIRRHYGPEAEYKIKNHLMESLHPETRNIMSKWLTDKHNYNKKSPTFSEEIMNHSRDILVNPEKRARFKKYVGDDKYDQHIKNLKQSVQQMHDKAKMITPEWLADTGQNKMAASEGEKSNNSVLQKPYKSDQQRKWAHTENGTKALGGKTAVKEWDEATKGKELPKIAKARIDHTFKGDANKNKRREAARINPAYDKLTFTPSKAMHEHDKIMGGNPRPKTINGPKTSLPKSEMAKARVDEGKSVDQKRADRNERASSWERQDYGMHSGKSSNPAVSKFLHNAKLNQIKETPKAKLPIEKADKVNKYGTSTNKGRSIQYNNESGVNKPYAMGTGGNGISSQGYTVRGAKSSGLHDQQFRQKDGGSNYDRGLARDKAKSVLSDLKSMPKPNLPKSEDMNKATKLEHYSSKEGLKQIDPKFNRTGVDIRTKGRDTEHPHSFFYRAGSTPEDIVRNQAQSKYVVEIPDTAKLYDIGTDPHDYSGQVRKENGDRFNMDNMHQKIKDAGHEGFYNSTHPSLSHVVALYNAHDVKEESKK